MSEINGKLNNVQNIKGVISNSESLNANVNLNVGLVPEIQIGETITLNSNEKAFVELDAKSTKIKPIFNFGIPKGDKGETSAGTKYFEGEGIEISEDNIIKILKASSETLGGIKVGENLTIDENGVLSATGGGGISEIPIATADTLGGIKVGENLEIDDSGVLNAISNNSDPGIITITEDMMKEIWVEQGYSARTDFYPAIIYLKYGCGIYKVGYNCKLSHSLNETGSSLISGDMMIMFDGGKWCMFFLSTQYAPLQTFYTNNTITKNTTYSKVSESSTLKADWIKNFHNLESMVAINNTTIYTPSNDYNPAHKKYVDDSIANNLKNYALKSEIPDVSEFQTAEEVTALINTAIGGIENGSY